jgi:HPt (histidine-containing phosphotransfer) domain-containing protein
MDILLNFCRDAEGRQAKLSETLETGDLKLYVTLVHAFKGAARSIGALEIGEAAAWLEAEAEHHPPDIVRSKNADLLEKVKILIAHIKNAAARESGNTEGQSDISALQLDKLKAALADMNIEAVNKLLLEYANLPLDGRMKNMISEVEEHILMFEYDKAIETIDKLS